MTKNNKRLENYWIPLSIKYVKPKLILRLSGWGNCENIFGKNCVRTARYGGVKIFSSAGRESFRITKGIKFDYQKVICGCYSSEFSKFVLVSSIFSKMIFVFS